MKLIYLSYWGLSDGLTQSSVIPHLKILAEKQYIDQILFLTIERTRETPTETLGLPKVTYVPLYSRNLKVGLANKINDFIVFTRQVSRLVAEHQVDHLLCRTSMAGSIGYLVSRKTGIPYSVESFEPHADYMLDAGVWSRWGPKYLFQKYWEDRIKKTSRHVVTVSKHFADKIHEEISGKVYTYGCAVDLERFTFNEESRKAIREQLKIDEQSIVGIYVGKFGDIYYDEEAFVIFKKAFDLIKNFYLILLTPSDRDRVRNELEGAGVSLSRCFINLVAYHQVPDYLSAADFAFSMVRPAPVRLYCSPIKDGEYWANGLPLLTADNIGEDSELISRYHAGAILHDDLSNLAEAILKVISLAVSERPNSQAIGLAKRYRSFHGLHNLYNQMFQG